MTHRPLTVGVDGCRVSSANLHQAVQRSSFAVQARTVTLDFAPTVQHYLRTQREILHQHPPVVQHLALTLVADRTTCTAQDPISNTADDVTFITQRCIVRLTAVHRRLQAQQQVRQSSLASSRQVGVQAAALLPQVQLTGFSQGVTDPVVLRDELLTGGQSVAALWTGETGEC